MRSDQNRKALARKLSDLVDESGGDISMEEACAQLGVDPDDGWELLAEDLEEDEEY